MLPDVQDTKLLQRGPIIPRENPLGSFSGNPSSTRQAAASDVAESRRFAADIILSRKMIGVLVLLFRITS